MHLNPDLNAFSFMCGESMSSSELRPTMKPRETEKQPDLCDGSNTENGTKVHLKIKCVPYYP